MQSVAVKQVISMRCAAQIADFLQAKDIIVSKVMCVQRLPYH